MRFLLITLVAVAYLTTAGHVSAAEAIPWWQIQSIDTMKYSRDLARQTLENPAKFQHTIETQTAEIAAMGATHIAIDTPYDKEFIPVLTLWVASARAHNLSIWFRGNFSGWEKWFDYPKITREQHTSKMRTFLESNIELFRNGDIFTPCPECEMGGPGDPRSTGDTAGFRAFMIEEKELSESFFKEHEIRVATNFASMNLDVARLVMDPDTTRRMNGVVTIDHYVRDPKKISEDATSLAAKSGGEVIIGEFGAPIPDINGRMSAEEQNTWIYKALSELASNPTVIGVNYWVSHGGSTALFDDDIPRPATATIRSYFQPQILTGKVVHVSGKPLADVLVSTQVRQVYTDPQGVFHLPVLSSDSEISVSKPTYVTQNKDTGSEQNIVLNHELPGWCRYFRLIENFCEYASSLGSY